MLTSWFSDQRGTHKLFVGSSIDVAIRKSGCCPRAFAIPSSGRLQHASAADLLIAFGREPSPDQVAAIVVEQGRAAIGGHVDAGTTFRIGHFVRFPELVAGACFEADKLAGRTRRVDEIITEQRGRGVAQDSAGGGPRLGPDHVAAGLSLIELHHQAADQ